MPSPLVQPKVVFPVPGDRVVVNITYDAIFSCAATGLPAPTITWQLNGVSVNDIPDLSPHLEFSNTTIMDEITTDGTILRSERTMTIVSAKGNYSGVYTCVATIDEIPDEDSQDLELYVQSKSCCPF